MSMRLTYDVKHTPLYENDADPIFSRYFLSQNRIFTQRKRQRPPNGGRLNAYFSHEGNGTGSGLDGLGVVFDHLCFDRFRSGNRDLARFE
jgi:hypothetical protein